jgi:hypothetical protein
MNNYQLLNCFCDGGMSFAQVVGCSNGLEMGNTVVNGLGNACLDHWGGSQNIRIIGNYLYAPFYVAGFQTGTAININGSDGTGTVAHKTSNIVVTGNVLYGAINMDSFDTGTGFVQSVENCIISDNVIVGKYGIFARGNTRNNRITNNYIDVTPSTGNSPISGIWIDNGSAAGGSSTGTAYGNTISNNTVVGFVGNTVNAITANGARNVVVGNITSGAYNLALGTSIDSVVAGNYFADGAYGSTVVAFGSNAGPYNIGDVRALTLSQQAIDSLTATGTNLATAYVLTKPYSSFNTVAAGTGASLPANAGASGQMWIVWNNGVSTLTLYAKSGDSINYSSSISVATGTSVRVVSLGNGLWRTT